MTARPTFDPAFQEQFLDLLQSRRDVRHFEPTHISEDVVAELVELTRHSPSVGYSQPWRFVSVADAARRAAVICSFERANADALSSYQGPRRLRYARLKLAGLREAPVHLAVFSDSATVTGKGLGAKTMPQTREYSTVMAIYTLWLTARVRGIGLGWVSILEPEEIRRVLDVPESWSFVAYLCLGYPTSYERVPELVSAGWEAFDPRSVTLLHR